MSVVSDAAQSSGDVMRRLAELEREVRELRAARRLEAASIGRGGLTVRGGTVRFESDAGEVRTYFGPITHGGVGSAVGFLFVRNNGVACLALEGGDPDAQFVSVRDEAGNIVFSDDAASGRGLATPWLTHAMAPAFNSSSDTNTVAILPGTTSSTFTGVLEASVPLTHPRLRMLAIVGPTDGSTAGEGRWMVDGQQVGSTVAFSGGAEFISQVVDVPGWSSRPYLQEVPVQVQVRRTSGSGRVVAACYGLYCRQS